MKFGFFYSLLTACMLLFVQGCGSISKNLPPTPINRTTHKNGTNSNIIAENFKDTFFKPIAAKYLYAMLALVFLWFVLRTWELEKKRLRIKYSDEDRAFLKIIKDNAARMWRNQRIRSKTIRLSEWKDEH